MRRAGNGLGPRRNGNGARVAAGRRAGGPDPAFAALRTAWQSLGKRLPAMGAEIACYSAVQVDRVRLAFRVRMARLVRRVFLAAATLAVFTIAATLLIVGIAGGVAAAIPEQAWLADVVTGAGVLIMLAVGAAVVARAGAWRRLRHLRRRYAGHEARRSAAARTGAPESRQHVSRS